jgi:hypothetical protein
MPSPTPSSISAAWLECKKAYDDAVIFSKVGSGWADKVTQGWRDYLAQKAEEFKSRFGIEFNPHIPVDDSVEPAGERKGAA